MKNVNKQLKSADIFFPQLSYKKFHKMKSSWHRKVYTRAINFCQKVKKHGFFFEIWKFKFFFLFFDFLAKIYGPSKELSMLGRFDFMKFFVQQLWEKIVSWFQLFVYIFQKKNLSFSSFGSTGKISLKIADYGEFSILRKMSADFSCLFTFFQKNGVFIIYQQLWNNFQ